MQICCHHASFFIMLPHFIFSTIYSFYSVYVFGHLCAMNDTAERCIKSITDYTAATQDSVYREDILLVGNSHREVFQDLRKAALANLDIN